jgi:peptidoglycan/LPS O-acetylase OafA/YrhL
MIRSLQACRCFAALLVVLHHTSNSIFNTPKYFAGKPFGNLFDFGEAGIDYLLVLSGFIITYVHGKEIGQPGRVLPFIRKRLTRVYPTYWVILALLLPVYFVMPTFGAGFEREPDSVLCALLLVPHLHHPPILIVTWMMMYEFVFYGIFAVLIGSRRWGLVTVGVWLALTIAAQLYAPLNVYPIGYLTSSFHLRILAGMVLALMVKHGPPLPAPRLIAILAGVFLVVSGLNHALGGRWTLYDPVTRFTPACIALTAGLIYAERAGSLPRVPELLMKLGDASYSIFLVHFPALSVLAKLAKLVHADAWLPGQVLYVLLFVAAVATGYGFFCAVERPLRHWLKEPAARRAAPAEPQRRAA